MNQPHRVSLYLRRAAMWWVVSAVCSHCCIYALERLRPALTLAARCDDAQRSPERVRRAAVGSAAATTHGAGSMRQPQSRLRRQCALLLLILVGALVTVCVVLLQPHDWRAFMSQLRPDGGGGDVLVAGGVSEARLHAGSEAPQSLWQSSTVAAAAAAAAEPTDEAAAADSARDAADDGGGGGHEGSPEAAPAAVVVSQ
jgi:hypothetical protein